ncbi:ABC transporter [Enterococcus sp. 669A]|uniref:ABC transporter n=1 Tax=Candidatus Enterococcus moelleringii TaxID=2815325 RepID=A0ABS3LKF5_9ENTE|nr:ABC transporter [Enterococcus sp. 669A]MBO1308839.1 ABC transporter [Enterococcus sp. 669A]
MKLQQIKALIKTNVLCVNPSATNQSRKKGKTGAKLIRSIFSSYILSGILFLVIYVGIMFMIDFSKYPGYFTYYMALFGLIGLSQAMSSIFNVFFESRDLENYLSLPFRQGEVFLAKFLVVGITIVPFLLPLMVVFFLAAWRGGQMIVLAVLSAFILFVVFVLLLFGLCSLFIFGLTQTKLFARHKKAFTTGMLVLSMVISIGGILIINSAQNQVSYSNEFVDKAALAPFMPFFYAVTAPFSASGLMSIAGLLAALGIIFVILRKNIVPKLYKSVSSAPTQSKNKSRKRKENQNLVQLMRSYNMQLIKNPNLVMQMLSSSLIMPVVFFITFMTTGDFSFSGISLRFFGVFFVAGIFIAGMTINQTSFVSSIISLDRENFSFIRSLPLSFKSYMRIKFWFACSVQIIITGGVGLLGGLIFRLPFLLLLSMMAGIVLGTILISLHFFIRDYQLLNLTWNNISELFTRGSGNFALVFWMFGVMIIGGILVAAYTVAVAIQLINPWLLNGAVFLVIAVIAVLFLKNKQTYFWNKLMD